MADPAFEILYLAQDATLALFEVQALLGSAYPGAAYVPNPAGGTWTLFNVQVDLQAIVDFTRLNSRNLIVWGGGCQESFLNQKGSRHPPPCPIIAQSLAAFRRDLPSLLKIHKGEWVAYSTNKCIGFGTSETQLYQECFRRGLKRGDFIVVSVEPDMPREIDLFLERESLFSERFGVPYILRKLPDFPPSTRRFPVLLDTNLRPRW